VEEDGVEGVGQDLSSNSPALIVIEHLNVHQGGAGRKGKLGNPALATIRGLEDPSAIWALAHNPAVVLIATVNAIKVEAAGLVVDGLEGLASVRGLLDDSKVAISSCKGGRISLHPERGGTRGVKDNLDPGGVRVWMVRAALGLSAPSSSRNVPSVVGRERSIASLRLTSPGMIVQGLFQK
jgi:hypothetical protein